MACILICPYCKRSYCAKHGSQSPCPDCAQRFFGMPEYKIQGILRKEKWEERKKLKQKMTALGFDEKSLQQFRDMMGKKFK